MGTVQFEVKALGGLLTSEERDGGGGGGGGGVKIFMIIFS